MATTTITVREIRPPKPGGKKYVVVDVRGDFYYIWPNEAGNYQVGQTYDINFSSQDFRGSTIRSIESATASSAPPQQAPAPRPANGQATGSGGYNTYRETSAADKLSMFVTAIVKAGIQSGQVQFNDEAIAIAIQQVVNGYRDGWTTARQQVQQPAPAPRPAPAPSNDMDDDIPF